MDKQKNIFHGVALFFCIDVIVTLLINILQISIIKTPAGLYIIPALSLAIYATILYFIFAKTIKFPQITMLLFTSIFIIRILSPNIFSLLVSEEETSLLEKVKTFDIAAEFLYTLIFASLAHRCYKKGLKENSDQTYIYYGIMLIMLAYSVINIIVHLLLLVARFYYIHPVGALILAICCIALFAYLFIKVVKSGPAIHLLIVFILVTAQYLIPYLKISGDLHSVYKVLDEYSLTSASLISIRGFTYALLCIISFVTYYILQRGKKASFPKTKAILIISLFFVITILANFATNYLSGVKSLNESFDKSRSELPAIISSHFPQNSGKLYWVNLHYDRYKSIIVTYKGFPNVKEGEALLENGYLTEYKPDDPYLVYLNPFRIKEKLNARSIRYETLNINGKMYYPLPDFDFEGLPSDELSLCGLPSDFTIYVLDAKPEKLIDDNSLVGIMPDGWGNGYSKGICISKQRNMVIYWGAAW